MLGDEAMARRLIAARPGIVSDLPAHCRGMLNDAAWRGNVEAVATMLALGFDVTWGNEHGATALHAAAWQGYIQLVELLLQHGAPLDVRETEFHCTPLEWALHGSCNCRRPTTVEAADTRDQSYAAIVTALLTAGSPRPVDRLVHPCSRRIQEVLEAAGIVAEDDD
jgi:hypothetical protein